MNKEEIVLFMINGFLSDVEENMRLMDLSDEDIKSYNEQNKQTIEYLIYSLYEKMESFNLINHD